MLLLFLVLILYFYLLIALVNFLNVSSLLVYVFKNINFFLTCISWIHKITYVFLFSLSHNTEYVIIYINFFLIHNIFKIFLLISKFEKKVNLIFNYWFLIFIKNMVWVYGFFSIFVDILDIRESTAINALLLYTELMCS